MRAAPASVLAPDAVFRQSLQGLAAELTVPGMAYAVVERGEVTASGAVAGPGDAPLAMETPLRFASVTKALTGVLLMQAVERGTLDLDAPAATWVPALSERPDITVRHLAAHVSEGVPGEAFVYGTTRYARLGTVVAATHGRDSYAEALRAGIVEPAGMSWRDSPHLGAHAGFVSTVPDMARFVAALQTDRLVRRDTFDRLTRPYVTTAGVAQPVGVGWFAQTLGGERVVWSFGQDDPDHSSALILMLPDRDLALVLLANTDELSNPFRLLAGDVRTSPFATAFLDAFAPEVGAGISPRDRRMQDLLVAAWSEDLPAAEAALTDIRAMGPPTGGDFALHYVASHLNGPQTADFFAGVDQAMRAAHPTDRWVLLFSAELNAAGGRTAEAVDTYEALLALPNQEADGLWRLFRAWSYRGLATLIAPTDPARALSLVDQGLATGVRGETRDQLERLRASLSPVPLTTRES
ncbi:MAG: serine hydrolase domain-containing protein [Brevundimonas sp.]|nr:serine hydrolase domain-containing protein [Brevundimonas sp.]